MRRAGFVAGVLAVACLSAACGPTAEEVTPETSAITTVSPSTKVDPDAGLWDPCRLPDSAISATGLDPRSKIPDVVGVDFDGWQVCNWSPEPPDWYELTIFSGSPTLDEVRQRKDFTSFKDRSVDGRPGVTFLDVSDSRSLTCSVAVEVPWGTVAFRLIASPVVGKLGDPCSEVIRHADDLAVNLPRS
ncbi:DUF3558 domain-containing protein [Nocardia jiangsuensis]|uniref:DUF3558 domain-containing protein n=1 Tax=Nocardia jiangsuensis TaxID=1691563 RepID=A0ABV8DWF5_9NOCA